MTIKAWRPKGPPYQQCRTAAVQGLALAKPRLFIRPATEGETRRGR